MPGPDDLSGFDESPGSLAAENYSIDSPGVRGGLRSTPYTDVEGQGESMKRTAGVLMLLAAAAGCVSTQPGAHMASQSGYSHGRSRGPATVPGVMGPWGQPVPMASPYNAAPPSGVEAAYRMMNQSLPMNSVQQVNYKGIPGVVAPTNGIAPPGVPGMPSLPGMSPQGMAMGPGGMMPPGGMMGPGGPGGMMPPGGMMGPGGMMPPGGPGMAMGAPKPPGAVAAVGALVGGAGAPGMPVQRTEIYFTGPAGTRISWYAPHAGGKGGFSPDYIEAPGRYNFLQASIYRLKLTDIPNRAGMELYPTLEVVPCNPKTSPFLAHSAVPVTFTEEDFEQVASGNYVVKVIYLPDPQYQDLATTGPDELVSSRLEPGVDPIQEACRRGSILAVVRMGNILLELPNSPAMDAPGPLGPHPAGAVPPPPGAVMMPPPGAGMPTGGPMMLPASATPQAKAAAVETPTQPAGFKTAMPDAGSMPPPPPMPGGSPSR